MPTVVNTGRLLQLIKEKYKTQTAFAQACGVTKQYLGQILKGDFSPTLERAIQFADLLGVSVDELVIRGYREEV